MISPQHSSFLLRQAGEPDIPSLARHRAAMFRDMGKLASHHEAELAHATAAYLRDAIAGGAYLAWVAEDTDGEIIAGAGVQLRPMLPRPRPEAAALELGPEALIVNVYVEPKWRRRGLADALMRTVLDALEARGFRRIVLHASAEGRRLYERLGFVPTNEMRFEGIDVRS